MEINFKQLNEKLENILSYCIECKDTLVEQALGRSEILGKLRDKSDIVMEHIIKGIQYGSQYDSTLHYWAKEIFGNLQTLVYKKYKGKNYGPNQKDLKECLWNTSYDNLQSFKNACEWAKYSETQTKEGCYKNEKYSVEDLYKIAETFMDELIGLIINNKFSIDSIESLLRTYANK